ncbi:MAG: DUF4351 domain-containing protein [Capsulimonadaceae bacterium]
MAKPFDIATKFLVDADPAAWMKLLSLSGVPTEILDTDLSTSIQADRMIQVRNPDYVFNPELLANYKPNTVDLLFDYNSRARSKFGQMVWTAAILLRPDAQGPRMTGLMSDDTLDFRFKVLRVWEIPCDDLLRSGSVALLPLAPISKVATPDLPAVLREVRNRTEAQQPELSDRILWLTYTLLSLSHDKASIRELMKGVWAMNDWVLESSLVKDLLEETEARGEARGVARGKAEGKAEGKEEIVSLLLEQRFSTLPDTITALLDRLSSERMNDLVLALPGFSSLDDLVVWLADRIND